MVASRSAWVLEPETKPVSATRREVLRAGKIENTLPFELLPQAAQLRAVAPDEVEA